MRNSARGSTPKTNTAPDESNSNNAENNSAKKLKQARLPFKVIDPGTSPVSSKTFGSLAVSDKDKDAVKDVPTSEGRKRKMSYDTEDESGHNDLKQDDNTSKENVEILGTVTKKKKSTINSNETISCVISLLDEDDDDVEGNKDTANKSSVQSIAVKKETSSVAKDKRKSMGTPKTTSTKKEKNGSATKLQIKLPLSSGKKKRRKSSLKYEIVKTVENEKHMQELSSDEIEDSAVEHNPHKRTKFNDEDSQINGTKCAAADKEYDVIALNSESEEIEPNQNGETLQPTKVENVKVDAKTKSNNIFEKTKRLSKSLTENTLTNSKSETVLEKSFNDAYIAISDGLNDSEKEEMGEAVLSENDNEADDETDNLAGKSATVSSDVGENLKKSTPQRVERTQKGEKSAATSAKVLTPKQVKLMERRRKAREEKERKLQEEKVKKQQEKEEKELIRKREREEREEQKRKERDEKEDQKRKEREEKERKRLAEIEAKNEEKRKKNEAKEEEMRKRDEERKRKEQEKEEAELKKKKAAQAFTKFFVAKTPNNNQIKNEDDSNTGDGNKILAFRPFQIKGDMKMAPIIRKHFTTEAKNRLDDLLGCNIASNGEEGDKIARRKSLPKSQLYLSELRSGAILPGRWRRPSTESKDDVILIEDELERVGQEIVEEIPAYVREEMRVKFYKFHDNRRPPYYGTWRKKSSSIKARNPFALDKKFFDYEVDSDDEWEEEEPGESLEDGSDEDKEKDSEDDDYEVDNEWFVPHGHLSDEELQNEDEFGLGDDNTREAQKVKLQLLQQEFAQEMKKKTEKIKPRLIGCIWADISGNQPPECAKILWDTLEKKAMIFDDPPLIEEPESDRPSETNSPSSATNGNAEKATDKLKPIGLSDNMIKDLIRLVHGNNHAKNFLINEYIAYVEKTEESVKNGGLRKPLKSVVRDKIDELAEWQAVDAHASSIQEMEQAVGESADKKKKKVKKRLCWVVKQEMLDKMDLSSLELQNSWQYTLPPKKVKSDKEATKVNEIAASLTNESNEETPAENSIKRNVASSKEKPTKSHDMPSSANIASNEISSNRASTTPKAKKRVPLLMSVPKGQQFSTPTKNKLISEFLQQKNKNSIENPSSSPTSLKLRSNTSATSPNIADDDIVILD